jgi:23S rRNA pseudouridine2605 synthase
MERNNNNRSFGKPERSRRSEGSSQFSKPDYKKRIESSDRPERSVSSFKPKFGNTDKPFGKPQYGDRDSKPSYRDRDDKPRYGDRDNKSSERPSYRDRNDKPNYGEKRESSFKPKFADRDSKPSYRDRDDKPRYGDRDAKSSERPTYQDRREKPNYGEKRETSFKPKFGGRDSKPSYGERNEKSEYKPRRENDKDFSSSPARDYKKGYQKDDRPFSEKKRSYDDNPANDRYLHKNKPRRRTSEIDLPVRERPKRADVLELKNFKNTNRPDNSAIRLNKYIANAGICSRREADDLIISGAVAINGVIITELGTKVLPTDSVQYGGETLVSEKKKYVLLNKPKGYITTVDDPQERRTVMALVKDACKERLYPVGRLDRNTSGLLLFTNDGEIAKKLTHPRYGVKKLYHVELDRALSKSDLEKLWDGVELEDGIIKVDDIAYIDEAKNKKEIGIEIHTGKNRVIRRLFEALGYEVVKLDRTMFAGLTKKDIPRGMWRFLSEKEVSYLKMLQ